MTVVLAMMASDGVVMCADTAKTASTPLGQAIAVQEEEKIYAYGKCFIWGASGDMGVVQRIKHKLDGETLHHSALKSMDAEGLRAKVAPLVIAVQRQCRDEYIGPIHPQQMDMRPHAEVILAGCLPSGVVAILIDPSGKSEILTSSHMAIGSGAPAAMAIMHRHGSYGQLTTKLAQVICYRAIADTIAVTPMFLAEPITMGTVTVGDPVADTDPQVSILAGTQLNPLRECVGIWTHAERAALEKSLESLKVPDVGVEEGNQPPAVA